MTHEQFAKGLGILAATYRSPLSALQTEAYWSALSDMPAAEWDAAVRVCLRTCKFFPRPVEIREAVSGPASDRADVAWGDVLGEVRRVGYLGTPKLPTGTLEAIRQTWGSWTRLCQTLPSEGPELVGWMKQFKATHGTVGRRQSNDRLLTPSTVHPSIQALIDQPARKSGFERVLVPKGGA